MPSVTRVVSEQADITGLVAALAAKASASSLASHIAATSAHGTTGAVVGTTDTQTLTNKTISGASNTFSSIPESAVTSLTSDLALKAPLASPTFTGTVTAPTFSGALSGNATTSTTAGDGLTSASGTAPLTLTLNSKALTGTIATASGTNAGSFSSTNFTTLNAATDANTVSTIVKRDGSGNFTAGTITAALSGNATTSTDGLTSASGTAPLTLTLTTKALTGSVAAASGTNAGSLSSTFFTLLTNATDVNTNSALAKRDSSGGCTFTQLRTSNTSSSNVSSATFYAPNVSAAGYNSFLIGIDASNNAMFSYITGAGAFLGTASNASPIQLGGSYVFVDNGNSASNAAAPFIVNQRYPNSNVALANTIRLFRSGTGGVSFPNSADFLLSRYSQTGTNANTQLDIQLGNGGVSVPDVTVLTMLGSGKNGFGVTSPTAVLHLKAGTATANTGPLKLTSGTVLTTPEAGAIEFDGTHFYGTAGSTRYQLDNVAGGTPVTEVTGTTQQAAINNKYIASNASLVTITLPTTASLGDQVLIRGKGAGGWKLAQNASQTTHGAADTTTGTGGSLASQTRYDCLTVECITANTDWLIINQRGTLTSV